MNSTERSFRVLEVAATGTFGTVCVAEDLSTGKVVALKVLKREHLDRPRILARTRDEARILQELDHPAILTVHGLLHIRGRPVVVMEWVRGVSLGQLLRQHPRGVPPYVAISLIHQATDALLTAWRALPRTGGQPLRIIHRDIKPANLLVDVSGGARVIDFGIARADMPRKEAQTLSMVLGARAYLAPERLDGHSDGPSVDIYAFGIVLYELLCGERIEMSLHPTHHAAALAQGVRTLHPEGLEGAALDACRALISSMCHYRPEHRPDHAAVCSALDAIAEEAGFERDLGPWAAEHVLPTFAARRPWPVADQEPREELAFLAEHATQIGRAREPDIDLQVRKILRSSGASGVAEIERLHCLSPHWRPQPILEIIRQSEPTWWRFWRRPAAPEYTAALLGLLRPRRSDPAVQRQAESLRKHPDVRVQAMALELLGATRS